jgi:aarF domain-containing kinase
MYLEEFIKVAKLELSWEVDYVREAECTKRFASLVKNMPFYKVPEIIGNFKQGQLRSSISLLMIALLI